MEVVRCEANCTRDGTRLSCLCELGGQLTVVSNKSVELVVMMSQHAQQQQEEVDTVQLFILPFLLGCLPLIGLVLIILVALKSFKGRMVDIDTPTPAHSRTPTIELNKPSSSDPVRLL